MEVWNREWWARESPVSGEIAVTHYCWPNTFTGASIIFSAGLQDTVA